MSKPWERYQAPAEDGPWAKYAAPEAEPAMPTRAELAKREFLAPVRTVRDVAAGAVRGAGSIGATLFAPFDAAEDAIQRLVTGKPTGASRNAQRREAMTGALGSMGADTDSLAFGAGKLGGEIAGTLGVGPALAGAAPAAVASRAPALVEAVRTAGMSAGGLGGKAGLAARTAGGAVAGGASAALVDPGDAGAGAAIGALLPGALQAAGRAGQGIGRAYAGTRAPGAAALARALDLQDPAAIASVVSRLKATPELVPGSRPTVAQSLRTPQAGILERVVSDSAGGVALKDRMAAQNAARLAALEGVAPTVASGAATARQDFGETLGRYATAARAGKRAQTKALYEAVPQDEAAIYAPDLAAIRDEFYPAGAFTDRGAVDKAVSTVESLGTVTVQPPKLPSATQAGRPRDLAQAVRAAGGVDLSALGNRAGEVRGLTGDIKNMVRRNGGLSLERMAEKMQQLGYIEDNSVDTLIDALRSNSRTGPQFSMNDLPEAAWERARYADAPTSAEAVPVKMTLRNIEAVRASIGQEARQAAMKGDDKAAKALGAMREAIDARIDEVVRGDGRIDEVLPIDWADKLSAARKSKVEEVQRFGTGPQAAMFRRGSDGAPLLQGGEIASKFWGSRPGLADDVKSLRRLIEDEPKLLGQFRSMVTTEGAGTATNAGNLTGKFVRWVENTLPGLKAGFDPAQVKALQRIAADIKRSEVAAAAGMSRGSNTYQNAQNALNLGMLDSPMLSATVSRIPLVGGVGNALLGGVTDSVRASRAKQLAELLADADVAGNALQQYGMRLGGNPLLSPAAEQFILRGAPVALSGRGQ